MSVSCCDPKSLPRTDPTTGKQIAPPNRVPLPANEWVTVEINLPTTIQTLTDPGGTIVAHPLKDNGADVTVCVYVCPETTGVRTLYLHSPGQWRVRNNGTAVLAVKKDTYNDAAAAFYGGVRVTGIANPVNIGTFAPGTFTPTHDTEETVDAGSETVLAAGSYKHIYFRNTSTGGQRITICGAGIAAVDMAGWVLYPDPTGNGAGDILTWNHPDVMPVGDFTAIANAAGGKLIVSSGV